MTGQSPKSEIVEVLNGGDVGRDWSNGEVIMAVADTSLVQPPRMNRQVIPGGPFSSQINGLE